MVAGNDRYSSLLRQSRERLRDFGFCCFVVVVVLGVVDARAVDIYKIEKFLAGWSWREFKCGKLACDMLNDGEWLIIPLLV